MIEEEIKEKHKTEIEALYFEWGVGDTIEHKVRFWNARDNCNYSHDPINELKVALSEQSYLADKFPGDSQYY